MERKNRKSSRSEEVYQALLNKKFPEELCHEIAYKYMTTDYTATRMLGYLYRITDPSIEMVVDEMLAILEDRERFRKKHESEAAQAAITHFYNEDFELNPILFSIRDWFLEIVNDTKRNS